MAEPMKLYTIYFNTRDLLGVYSVREHIIEQGASRPGELLGTAETLYEARALVPRGLIFTPRHPRDDRNIVETWI